MLVRSDKIECLFFFKLKTVEYSKTRSGWGRGVYKIVLVTLSKSSM